MSTPNAENKELRNLFHEKSERCDNAKRTLDKSFKYRDKKTGRDKFPGFPKDLSSPVIHLSFTGPYKDTTTHFGEYEGHQCLLFQKQKYDYYDKTYNWDLNHRDREVSVITASMGGRILKGTLIDFKENYLYIKVN